MISLVTAVPRDDLSLESEAKKKSMVRKRPNNALKTGFYSKQVLIQTKYYCEDPKAFESSCQRLRQAVRPQNEFEEELCDKIAAEFHLLNRAQQYETKIVEDEIGSETVLSEQEERLDQLKKQIEDAKPYKKLYPRQLKLIEQFRNHAFSLSELDKQLNGYAIRILKEKAGKALTQQDERALVVAGKLDRLEYFFVTRFKWDSNLLAQILTNDLSAKLQKCTRNLAELRRSQRTTKRKYRTWLQDRARRFLLPPPEAQERLERFNAMHIRKAEKLTDVLLKLRLASTRLLEAAPSIASPSLLSHDDKPREVRCRFTEVPDSVDTHIESKSKEE